MPTYEYLCKSCGERSEHWQSMKAGALRKCRKCGAPRGLRRLIGSGAAVIFKGDPTKFGNTGFYGLDYKTNNGVYDIDRQRENVREHEIQRGE